MVSKERPYVLYVAEVIYLEISQIRKKNPNLSNFQAIENFIGSSTYKKIGSGEFHDNWFRSLKKNNFIDQITKKKIPDETVRLLKVQREMMVKYLIQFPKLYYTKTNSPLEISKRAFNHLWRICESYELWCKETKQIKLITLKITD
tara:strand:+ start:166 stop:603 length:438 start_codon:yes stop_codon:yes gene_type:complete